MKKKNEDAHIAALLFWRWTYQPESGIPDAVILKLLRAVCKDHDLPEVGKAFEKLKRDGQRSGAKIRYLTAKLVIEKGRILSAREIRSGWSSTFGGKPPSERTIQYILDKAGHSYVRLKPWQQPK
jgi:hypothetical protein